MGLDSVEIVLCWEDSLGITIPDEELSKVTTPAESVELLASMVNVYGNNGPCLSMRAFHKVRIILENEFGVERRAIKPNTRFSLIFPKKGRRKYWAKFKEHIGINALSFVGWPLFAPGSTTINDVVCEIVARDAKSLIIGSSDWSISQLREVVRASVTFVAGVTSFSDSDHYIKDIGID